MLGGDELKCHFCKREPQEIRSIVDGASILKVSPDDYVKIDLETYHHDTNMFCCTRCYANLGYPKIEELHHSFRNYSSKVIDLKEVRANGQNERQIYFRNYSKKV